MRLLKTFQSESSKRKADIYFDAIQNEFIIEYYGEQGDFITQESFKNKKVDYVESIAVNWVIAKLINESVLNLHKAEVLLESLSDVITHSIHKQQNLNENLSNIILNRVHN